MPELYCLIGRKQSGKDTVGAILRESFMDRGRVVWMKSFAYFIKKTLVVLFGFPDISYFDDQEKKEKLWPAFCETHTPRYLMEWFGTEVIRVQFGENFWVNRLLRDIESTVGEDDVVIITDTRFPNEAITMFERYGSRLVYIDADRRLGPQVNPSVPEAAVKLTIRCLTDQKIPFDVIDNNGSKEFLHYQTLDGLGMINHN